MLLFYFVRVLVINKRHFNEIKLNNYANIINYNRVYYKEFSIFNDSL